jgi:hypothetical protein
MGPKTCSPARLVIGNRIALWRCPRTGDTTPGKVGDFTPKFRRLPIRYIHDCARRRTQFCRLFLPVLLPPQEPSIANGDHSTRLLGYLPRSAPRTRRRWSRVRSARRLAASGRAALPSPLPPRLPRIRAAGLLGRQAVCPPPPGLGEVNLRSCGDAETHRWPRCRTTFGTPPCRSGSTPGYQRHRSPSGPGTACTSYSRSTPSASTGRRTRPSSG